MNNIFLFKLILSFFIGGGWAIGTTIMAEKYGTKIGGLLAGFPSTTLIALFFIGWTQSAHAASQAAVMTPVVCGVNAFFVLIYIGLVKYKFSFAILGSISWWLFSAIILFYLKFNNYYLSIFLYILLLFTVLFIIKKKFATKAVINKKIKYTIGIVLFRGLISGSIISLAIILNKIGGPILGGIFSTFPAMFLSTMIITYRSSGANFSAAIMKSGIVGAITTVIYSGFVYYCYSYGIITGTVIGIVGSFISGLVVYQFVLKKSS